MVSTASYGEWYNLQQAISSEYCNLWVSVTSYSKSHNLSQVLL